MNRFDCFDRSDLNKCSILALHGDGHTYARSGSDGVTHIMPVEVAGQPWFEVYDDSQNVLPRKMVNAAYVAEVVFQGDEELPLTVEAGAAGAGE